MTVKASAGITTSEVAAPVFITPAIKVPVFFMEPIKIPEMIPAIAVEERAIVVEINFVAVVAAPCRIIRVEIEISLNRVFVDDGSGCVFRSIFVLVNDRGGCGSAVYARSRDADADMATNIDLGVSSGSDHAPGGDHSSN